MQGPFTQSNLAEFSQIFSRYPNTATMLPTISESFRQGVTRESRESMCTIPPSLNELEAYSGLYGKYNLYSIKPSALCVFRYILMSINRVIRDRMLPSINRQNIHIMFDIAYLAQPPFTKPELKENRFSLFVSETPSQDPNTYMYEIRDSHTNYKWDRVHNTDLIKDVLHTHNERKPNVPIDEGFYSRNPVPINNGIIHYMLDVRTFFNIIRDRSSCVDITTGVIQQATIDYFNKNIEMLSDTTNGLFQDVYIIHNALILGMRKSTLFGKFPEVRLIYGNDGNVNTEEEYLKGEEDIAQYIQEYIAATADERNRLITSIQKAIRSFD